MPEYRIYTLTITVTESTRKISIAWTIKKPSNRRCEL